jgi:hypothetical protein
MIGWLADDQHIQAAADDFSNISKPYAVVRQNSIRGLMLLKSATFEKIKLRPR